MSSSHPSPLRYPGGKAALVPYLTEIIRLNGLEGGIYAEPFAGGAGAALQLLFDEQVSEIYINDLDEQIYSFWKAILNHTDEFIALLKTTPVSVRHWRQQKAVLKDPKRFSRVQVGFATFYINRCNHSGVLNGGPIGGVEQTGNYKIDARFNKRELQNRIERIALYKDRITVTRRDGVAFMKWLFHDQGLDSSKTLVYMDPPYFEKAATLYDVYFRDSDHQALAKYLRSKHPFRWVVSYDNVGSIKTLYRTKLRGFLMQYSAHTARLGHEIIIPSSNCQLPIRFRMSGIESRRSSVELRKRC